MSELQKETLKLMGELCKTVAEHEKELQKHTDALQGILGKQLKMLDMIASLNRRTPKHRLT